jgi:hypothetical protein
MSSVGGGHAIDPTPVSPSHLSPPHHKIEVKLSFRRTSLEGLSLSHLSPPHHKIEVKLSFRRTSLEGLSLSHLSPVPSASQKRGGD